MPVVPLQPAGLMPREADRDVCTCAAWIMIIMQHSHHRHVHCLPDMVQPIRHVLQVPPSKCLDRHPAHAESYAELKRLTGIVAHDRVTCCENPGNACLVWAGFWSPSALYRTAGVACCTAACSAVKLLV